MVPRAVCRAGAPFLEEAAWQHALPSPGTAPAPCSAEMAHPLPGKEEPAVGCRGALLSACHLLPACSLPGSCLSLTGIPVVSRIN